MPILLDLAGGHRSGRSGDPTRRRGCGHERAAISSPATEFPTQVPATQAEPEEKVEFTHSGQRYLLGYGREYFGIWDRNAPATPAYRFARSDDGWVQAWQKYVSIETNYMDLRTGLR